MKLTPSSSSSFLKKDVSSEETTSNQRSFSPAELWQKLANTTKRLGKETVEKILWLYYATKRPNTPRWAKTVVYSALAYFILPTDAIPDFIPISGYADDLAAITAAVTTIAAYIDAEVKQKTNQKLHKWFGVEESEEAINGVNIDEPESTDER